MLLDVALFGFVGNAANIFLRAAAFTSVKEAYRKTMRTAIPVLLADIRIFPPAELLAFSAVPEEYRTTFISAVSLGWNTYISIVAAGGH